MKFFSLINKSVCCGLVLAAFAANSWSAFSQENPLLHIKNVIDRGDKKALQDMIQNGEFFPNDRVFGLNLIAYAAIGCHLGVNQGKEIKCHPELIEFLAENGVLLDEVSQLINTLSFREGISRGMLPPNTPLGYAISRHSILAVNLLLEASKKMRLKNIKNTIDLNKFSCRIRTPHSDLDDAIADEADLASVGAVVRDFMGNTIVSLLKKAGAKKCEGNLNYCYCPPVSQ